jgi:hypothetical protein
MAHQENVLTDMLTGTPSVSYYHKNYGTEGVLYGVVNMNYSGKCIDRYAYRYSLHFILPSAK